MTKAEELYHQIADSIPGITKSKMFGAQCLKAPNGKAGVMFWKEFMVFKLDKAEEKKAMGIKGARIFDPAGGRPMNGWVQVPESASAEWKNLAKISMDYVKKIVVDEKKTIAKSSASGKPLTRLQRVKEVKKEKEKSKLKKPRRVKPKSKSKRKLKNAPKKPF
jgi:hypothetical protein